MKELTLNETKAISGGRGFFEELGYWFGRAFAPNMDVDVGIAP